ncbi:MAG: hypothetical protein BGO05_16685 [Rhizobiales bacterium 63-7]|nr:MAG: hypothetical protein BGO05_16685 [Rhizobiales bacterium 63-7]
MRQDNFAPGLYFAIGRTDPDEEIQPQYVGISTALASKVGNRHHKLGKIDNLSLWVGEVGTAAPGGRKLKKTPPTLDMAEWLLAFFLAPALNQKKTIDIPNVAVSLLNRWWKTDYETPYVRRPHADWPDLIDYLGHYYPTKIVWFGGKLKRVPPIIPSA